MELEALHTMYRRQAAWFAGERSRLLRRVHIAAKRRVLDLGAGTGEVLPELARRAGGPVVGLDRDAVVLRRASAAAPVAAGEAVALPFGSGVFDLVFTQMFFLWAAPLEAVIRDIHRVLAPGGHLIACAEPDYGGAIAYPDVAAGIGAFVEGLRREGADPCVARKLGCALREAGFSAVCGVHPARPLEAGRSDSPFAAPELLPFPQAPAFLFIPYFHFVARKP